MMTCCFLCHPYHRGGVTQWMANSFNAWNVSAEEAGFITVQPSREFISASGRPLIASLLDKKFDDYFYATKVGHLFDLGTRQHRAKVYQRLIQRHVVPDVPIIPSDDESCWMAAASCALRNPFIAVLHADEDIYYELAERYRDSVTAFICVSSRILSKLLERHPEFAHRSFALPCGIPVDKFQTDCEKHDVISWAGRVTVYQKRAQDILPIFSGLLSTGVALRLDVLGDGDYLAELQKQVDLNPLLRSTVKCHGWIVGLQIIENLSRAKIFLQTSDFEGTSVAMMEALASGCAIVCTRVSGVEDLEGLKEADGVVFLYNPGDVNDGVRKVSEAISRYNDEIRRKATMLAWTYFDCNRNNKMLTTFICRVIKERAKQPQNFKLNWKYRFSPLLAIIRLLKWKLTMLWVQQSMSE